MNENAFMKPPSSETTGAPTPFAAGPVKPAGNGPERTPSRPMRRFAAITAAVVLVGLGVGFLPRWHARRALAAETRELAVPTVEVISPAPGEANLGAPLPAEVQPYVEAPIYARASGYLRRWLVDIGAHVQAGQLLAEIDTPELDQQIDQARAEVAQAEAALALAETTSKRWTDLLKTASVSEQETAEKQADYTLKQANLEASRANLRRLEDLKSFDRVTAPFAGTITARETDVGQLITAGSGHELFRLAQTSPLRIYVRVPQTMSRAIEPGQTAELTLNEMPGRQFEAKVVRTAGAIEPASRTLLVELQADNPRGEILSGSYAQVRFTDAQGNPILTLPSNTLLFRSDGMEVGVVSRDGRVVLRPVKLGRDFGQKVEIVAGVGPTDRVIMNPSDSLAAGTVVRVAQTQSASDNKRVARE